jgi:hypothetical protein
VLHAEKDKDPSLNHLLMAHKHPEVAAQHMDICKSLLTTLYLLHKKMVGEVTHMLEEFTEPEKVQARMQKLRNQTQYSTPYFTTQSFIDLSDQVSNPVPPTPSYVPHYPNVLESFDAGYMGDDSGNPANPESPLENSTGWHFGEPLTTEEFRCVTNVSSQLI